MEERWVRVFEPVKMKQVLGLGGEVQDLFFFVLEEGVGFMPARAIILMGTWAAKGECEGNAGGRGTVGAAEQRPRSRQLQPEPNVMRENRTGHDKSIKGFSFNGLGFSVTLCRALSLEERRRTLTSMPCEHSVNKTDLQ